MDIKQTLRKYKRQIDKELEIYFKQLEKKTNNIDPSVKEIIKNIKEFTLRGGKRIRSALAIITYEGFGGKNKDILKIAVSIELMQSFLLIHDDIMDQDSLRRGKPTFHKIYEKKKKSEIYGISNAIISGDILSALGTEIILNTNFDVKLKQKALTIFNRVIINTCFGQLLDIESPKTETDISKIHTLKTAIYTMEGPLHIGAILAGAKDKHLKQLTKVAIPIGKAFQIQDDILGLFGNQKRLGKPVGSDIKEGKKTLLILKSLENADKKDRKFIKKCLGNKKITSSQINKLRNIVKNTGAYDYSKELAEKLIIQGKKHLRKLGINSESKQILNSLADYMLGRSY